MAKEFISTDVLDIKVGDIYYANRGYNMCSPRFYKVTKITDKMVEFEGIAEMFVHYRRTELKYGSNSPEYYVIPAETFNLLPVRKVGLMDDEILDLKTEGGTPMECYFKAEDGRTRVFPSFRDSFKSKVRCWTRDSWENGVREKVKEYYMKEAGTYGGLLYKYKPGTAINGYCD